MELEGSLPCSQQPASGPYSEPDESSPHLYRDSVKFRYSHPIYLL